MSDCNSPMIGNCRQPPYQQPCQLYDCCDPHGGKHAGIEWMDGNRQCPKNCNPNGCTRLAGRVLYTCGYSRSTLLDGSHQCSGCSRRDKTCCETDHWQGQSYHPIWCICSDG